MPKHELKVIDRLFIQFINFDCCPSALVGVVTNETNVSSIYIKSLD